jgi:chaperonin cofactor prefoldin
MLQLSESATKAFNGVQTKLLQTNKLLADVNAKRQRREMEMSRASITLRDLQTLDANVATYEKVGRMFLLTDQEPLKQKLAAIVESAQVDLENYKKQVAFLSKQQTDYQNSIREIIMSQQRS